MTRMTCKPFRIVAMSSHWTNSKLDQPIRNKDWRRRPQIQKRIPMTSITWPGLTTQWRKPCNFLPVFYYNLNVMKKKTKQKIMYITKWQKKIYYLYLLEASLSTLKKILYYVHFSLWIIKKQKDKCVKNLYFSSLHFSIMLL